MDVQVVGWRQSKGPSDPSDCSRCRQGNECLTRSKVWCSILPSTSHRLPGCQFFQTPSLNLFSPNLLFSLVTLTLSISSPLFLSKVYSISTLCFRFILVSVRQLCRVLRAFSAIAPAVSSSSISPAVSLADRWRRPCCISYTESNAITVSARGTALPHTGAGTRRSPATTDDRPANRQPVSSTEEPPPAIPLV